jgi:hypothetical protein
MSDKALAEIIRRTWVLTRKKIASPRPEMTEESRKNLRKALSK